MRVKYRERHWTAPFACYDSEHEFHGKFAYQYGGNFFFRTASGGKVISSDDILEMEDEK